MWRGDGELSRKLPWPRVSLRKIQHDYPTPFHISPRYFKYVKQGFLSYSIAAAL